VFVEIPIDLLEEGTDTLLVQVTDQSELLGRASTTVLWRTLYPDSDDDGDGWGDEIDEIGNVDCDDSNITIYPGAAELPDGLDNDCDGAIDENSLGGDDDGDSVSELEGDCDDFDAETYPGAMEKPDQKDNDCDGTVDEGTSFVDDDGDGFSELDLDCDDDDPNSFPGAPEYCDDKDNNCNFINDSAEPGGCIDTSSQPLIIGGIQMNQTAIGSGESTTMTVFVFEEDGQTITYDWSQEDSKLQEEFGHVAVSSPTAQNITWTAPTLPEESPGYRFTVTVIVEDEDGNQAWIDDEVWVYPTSVATEFEQVDAKAAAAAAAENESGCGKSSSDNAETAALLAVPFFGLLALARRRED
jgi:MYXO-CTERM domain-containing protein